MHPQSHDFKARAARALANPTLRQALDRARGGFVDKRREALASLSNYSLLRDQATAIREHTLEYLDVYLERYADAVERQGGQVHWAANGDDACRIVTQICRNAGVQRVAKGKSMVSEEIGLNAALEAAGLQVVETDLGEYIIQLARETPSHIIAPAVHKTREQIADLFHFHHDKYGLKQRLQQVPELVNEARHVMRDHFLQADAGITGANFLVAVTGSNVIVTNEGNGDLTSTLPKVHIVTAGIEKIVPTLADVTILLRVLARNATGQALTSYTTFSSGPRRLADVDGPQQYHVVLVDNGRSNMLADEFREMLRCIRCGACMNHCPVYGAIGGHAYGWVYPGPMGAVLTPLTIGLREAGDLPNACTLNGHCADVCPVKIPLPDLLRSLRHRQFELRQGLRRNRWALAMWGWLARHPSSYRFTARLGVRLLSLLAGGRGRFTWLPFAGDWFRGGRDLPAPAGDTFLHAWRKQRGNEHE